MISDNPQISVGKKAGCTLLQKQPPEVFYKKKVFKDFTKFTEKQLCRGLFFNKATGLTSSNFRNLI